VYTNISVTRLSLINHWTCKCQLRQEQCS